MIRLNLTSSSASGMRLLMRSLKPRKTHFRRYNVGEGDGD